MEILQSIKKSPLSAETTSAAKPSINVDEVDVYSLTAQAVNIDSFTDNLSGTPVEGQTLLLKIKGTGARTITWGTSFENGIANLPTTTVGTDTLYVHLVYNSLTSKWRYDADAGGTTDIGAAIEASLADTPTVDTWWGFTILGVLKKISNADFLIWLGNTFATVTALLGKKNYHGIEVVGTRTFNNTTHALTIASGTNTYWYKGTKYTTAAAIACDLDLTADRDHISATLTAHTLYYFYFKDATGKLYWSPTSWDLKEHVPVEMVFWNGSAGAKFKEIHGHDRDIPWHQWAHDTVGMRYESGGDKTYPTIAAPTLLQIETCNLHDEDVETVTGQQTVMRAWYKANITTYTFADYAFPYLGTSGQPKYLRTSDYSLQNVGATDYACFWVYGNNDEDRPIAVIPTQAAAAYNTVNLARAETQPVISGLNLAPEWKLLYRFIYKGNGDFVEASDYRNVTSLPTGGSTSIVASNVVVTPTGGITELEVQSALTGLDTRKLNKTRTGGTTSAAEPTINTDNIGFYELTAQAVNITSFTTNLTGAPVADSKLWIAITGTAARSITWGAKFESGAVTLPSTTVLTNRCDVAFIYNTTTNKWRCMATSGGA